MSGVWKSVGLVEMRYTKCPVMFACKTRIVPSRIPIVPLYTEKTNALVFQRIH